MGKGLKYKLNEVLGKLNRTKKIKKTESLKPDAYKFFGTVQVSENSNTATVLFETTSRAFDSESQKRDIHHPDVLVLHKDDKGNYLMTWHGMKQYSESYSYDNGATPGEEVYYRFATRGMYSLNEQQAQTLLTPSKDPELFQVTLKSIEKQKDLLIDSLTEKGESLRSAFIKKDFEFADEIKKKYLDDIREQDSLLRKEKEEQKKANYQQRINANTEKFLDILSEIDSRGK